MAHHYGSSTESPRTGPSASRNLYLAYKQTSIRLPTVDSCGVIRALPYSAPDGDQHCYDHEGSGGMRKSGHDVDDAGDASNTEIGHVPTCLLEPLSLSHHVCDLAESGGFLGGSGNLGNGLSRSPNGLSVRTAATAMPNQSCVTGREPRPLPCANWPPDCLNERDLPTARGEAAFSAKLSFRLTYR